MARNQLPILVRKVERWLRRHEIDAGGIGVAVSGGPDSVALLRALLAVRSVRADGTIIVAHLNHQLRGVASDADADSVRDLHAQLAQSHPMLMFRCDVADVAATADAERANV